MHAICQLTDQNGKSSMRYQGTAKDLAEILSHQGGENNWFYTLSYVKLAALPQQIDTPWKMRGTDFERTEYLAFDIDGIQETQDVNDIEHVCEAWLKRIGEPIGERHYIASGHGVHIILRIPEQRSIEFFKLHAPQYKVACSLLFAELFKAGITCKQVDPVIFEPSRLLRVPGSINVKKDHPPVPCRLIESLSV